MRRIAQTPLAAPTASATDVEADPFANGSPTPTVVDQPEPATQSGQHPFANGSPAPNAVDQPGPVTHRGLPGTLEELQRRWQPPINDDWYFPTLAQQRADALAPSPTSSNPGAVPATAPATGKIRTRHSMRRQGSRPTSGIGAQQQNKNNKQNEQEGAKKWNYQDNLANTSLGWY